MRKGDSRLQDPQLRRLRGLMMLEYKLKTGSTNEDVAKHFGVVERTVERTLSWMKRAGIIVSYEDKILEELMPLAHAALKDTLKDDKNPERAKMALEIFKGMLPSFNKTKVAGPSASSGGELAAYIDQLRGELGIIDGETVADPSARALPASSQGLLTEGAAELSGGDATGAGVDTREAASVGSENVKATPEGA